MNWIKVTDWEKVPVNSLITVWNESDNKPYQSWYMKEVTSNIFIGIIDGKVVFLNEQNRGTNSWYPYTLRGLIFKYLQEYEPYDPNQENEDDCL